MSIALHIPFQSDKMGRSALARLFVLIFVINATGRNDVSVNASRVTLTNNGYKNLVVAISPSAHADQSEIIISNIKVGLYFL
jgi:hypothetical protein